MPVALLSRKIDHVKNLTFDSMKKRDDMQEDLETDHDLYEDTNYLLPANIAQKLGVNKDALVKQVSSALTRFFSRQTPVPTSTSQATESPLQVPGLEGMSAIDIALQEAIVASLEPRKPLAAENASTSTGDATALNTNIGRNGPEKGAGNPREERSPLAVQSPAGKHKLQKPGPTSLACPEMNWTDGQKPSATGLPTRA